MGEIKYIDHTADIIVECVGESLKDAFETAAKALFNVMLNVNKVESITKVEISIDGFDLEELLLKWLEEFLIIFDSESLVFSKFNVENISENDDGWHLEAICFGESFDPEKHEFKTGVKAATYSEMEIKQENGKWKFHFVLDL